MALSGTQRVFSKALHPGASAPLSSHALEWMWQQLRDVRNPHVLDCGPVSPSTVEVLLRRSAKIYVADLIAPARRSDDKFWDRQSKVPKFRLDVFLAQLPKIPSNALSAVFCWQLFDLVPREALPGLFERLCSYLKPGGALFCLLREPYVATGADTTWWLEAPTLLVSGPPGKQRFPYPAVTNREMERLAPGSASKTFLTRSGRREVLAIIG